VLAIRFLFVYEKMNLAEHYHKLYTESIAKISAGNYETDHLIDSDIDQRFGITLVIRPDAATKQNQLNLISIIIRILTYTLP
jgi:hypothetical protein